MNFKGEKTRQLKNQSVAIQSEAIKKSTHFFDLFLDPNCYKISNIYGINSIFKKSINQSSINLFFILLDPEQEKK